MFKGRGIFNDLNCPHDQDCHRPYCPYKHSIPAVSKDAATPKSATVPSGPRQLPSYAPQNSQPKVTIDYKQLLRGCKSYKSPGKQNVKDKGDHKVSNKEKPAPVGEKPALIDLSSSADSKSKNDPVKQSGSKGKRSLFEKLSDSLPIKVPAVSENLQKPHNEEKYDPTEVDKDEEYCPETTTLDDETFHYTPSIDIKSNLVYKPGIGITEDVIRSPTKSQVSPTKNDNKSFLSSSLDFHDPYDNSVPTATSPSKANIDETFDLTCTRPQVNSNIPSSLESNTASLVIEENNAGSDNDEKLLSESEPEDLDNSSDEDLSKTQKSDDPIEVLDSSNGMTDKSGETNTSEQPIKLDLSYSKSPKEEEDEIFALHMSPVKFKKTFGRRKAPEPPIEVMDIKEEDEIMEVEFKKSLREDRMAKKSPVKFFDISPSKGSENDSENECDKETTSRIDREKRLEEIKNLKAKIFEKQWKQSKQMPVSSSSSESSSSGSSDSESSGSESSDSKSDPEDSDFSYHSGVSEEVSQETSDSDSSIDSNESVQSDPETKSKPTSNYSDSDSLPQRKRKKLSSPTHHKDSRKGGKPKPVLSLTPKQLERKKLKDALKCRAEAGEKVDKAKVSSLLQRQGSDPTTKFVRNFKESKEYHAKKQHREEKEGHTSKKKHSEISLKRKADDAKVRSKESKMRRKDDSKKLSKKSKLKPGIRAGMKSDQIIPHQRKLSERKLKIMAKYDKRMDGVNNHMDNSKTFYQKKPKSEPPSLSSKYKKEELSHFDPPTPPPDDDPHRWAGSNGRNKGKRVAHRPKTTGLVPKKPSIETEKPEKFVHLDGPRIDLKERTHVSASIRQTRLDYFITEYLKIWPNDRQKCFTESLKAERSCLDRCKTKQLYANICTNEVKKIRELKSKEGRSEGGAGGSEDGTVKNRLGEAKKIKFHDVVAKYRLPKTELTKNEFPGYYEYKPVVLDGLHCVRCSKLFQLDVQDQYTIPERCLNHSGRLRTRKSRGPKGELDSVRMYDCCDREDGSSGCSVSNGHVHNIAYINRDWKTYQRTKKKDRVASVWGLDCEMCYTAGGMELTRVTVVDMNGETALDMLVRPSRRVLDYNTRFSGIKESDLRDVENTLEDAQRAVCRIITWNCLIVGHSLESDLHALQLIHKNVVDTSMLFYGGGFKRGLATLSAEILGRIIQSDEAGHDSTEDALAALDLLKYHLKMNDNFKL